MADSMLTATRLIFYGFDFQCAHLDLVVSNHVFEIVNPPQPHDYTSSMATLYT